jgi:hypothetical protein
MVLTGSCFLPVVIFDAARLRERWRCFEGQTGGGIGQKAGSLAESAGEEMCC